MKHCAEKLSLLVVTLLTIAVFTTFLIAQTQEARDSRSYQSTDLAGLEHTTNTVSINHQSKKMTAGLGQTLKELKSKTVESKNGDKIGSISDLIIDTQSGRVAYVIIASRGFVGIGKKQKAVPPSAVSMATSKRNVVALNTTLNLWNRAPAFNKKQLAGLSEPAQSQKFNQYYQQQNTAATGQSTSTATLPPTGRTEAQMQLASDLIGKKVTNAQNQNVGKVSDVLVDISEPETRPAFAILKPGSLVTGTITESPGMLLAVPERLLRLTSDKDKLMLNINNEQFKRPEELTPDKWTEAGTGKGAAAIYTYRTSEFHPRGR